jgi:D-alanyl-D-alanine carboxypeptidase (penicillin-binding protein 5/6)
MNRMEAPGLYRVRVRSTKKPAPIHGLLLVGLLIVVGLFVDRAVNRGAINRPRRVVASTAVRYTPGIPPVPPPVPSVLPFPLGESSGILWNMTTHQLMWELHPNLEGPFASTTKLMTFYLVYHHLAQTRIVHINALAASTTGSDIYMAVGDHFTVHQLLYGMLMASANDAAVALANTVSPNTSAFVRLMNQTAQDFGMYHTHYQDPDGLSPGSYGSAWDLAVIAQQDLKIPLFRRIVDTKEISLPYNPQVSNLNGLLYLDPSVIGVKTGWTTQAGFNVVFEARRKVNGHAVTLLGILMHGQYGFPPVYSDAENLLNWGFAQVKKSESAPP